MTKSSTISRLSVSLGISICRLILFTELNWHVHHISLAQLLFLIFDSYRLRTTHVTIIRRKPFSFSYFCIVFEKLTTIAQYLLKFFPLVGVRLLRNSFTTLFVCFFGFWSFFSFSNWCFSVVSLHTLRAISRHTLQRCHFNLIVGRRFSISRKQNTLTHWNVHKSLWGTVINYRTEAYRNIRKQMADDVPQKRKVYDLSYNSVLIICWLVAGERWQLWVELNTEQLNLPTLDSFIIIFSCFCMRDTHEASKRLR